MPTPSRHREPPPRRHRSGRAPSRRGGGSGRHLWLLLGSWLALLSWSAPARSEQGLVVLDLGGADARVEIRSRTEDELRVAGFSVRVAEREAQELAEESGAIAVVSVRELPSPSGELNWVITVIDRVTGKTTERHVAADPAAPDAAAEAPRLALLAVELLYASLLELEATPPTRGPITPTPAVTREVRRRLTEPSLAPRWAVRGGAGVAVSPGGLGTTPLATVGASLFLGDGFGLDLQGLGTLAPAVVHDGSTTSARIAFGLARVASVATLWPRRRVSISAGLGVGALLVRARGEARAPLEAARDQTVVGLGTAAAAGTWRLQRRLRLRLDLAASLTFPAIDVEFAETSVASAGRPLLESLGSVEWAWR